ncbi:MAG TPA: GAF domain-containing SpoIIE family protein phosphatase [Acidobacteriota bacterium]|nr:GAF domain-containing SpoIIE family protein phosphatase [Acidobacteriota bacterium]
MSDSTSTTDVTGGSTSPTSEDVRWLSLLHEISQDLSGILDFTELVDRIAHQVGSLIDYRLFDLYEWDEKAQRLRARFSQRSGRAWKPRMSLEAGEGVCGWVALHKRSLRVPDVCSDHRFVDCASDIRVRSELAVPLLTKGRLVGVLNLESDRVDAFSQCHADMLETLANPIAVALENARLVEELRSKESSLLKDLSMARQVQSALLPAHSPLLDGIEIGRSWLPARELGGDFYDFLACGPDRLTIAVGDVSGKSTPAALYGSMAIGALRAQIVHSPCSPATLLRRMNTYLLQPGLDNRFLAMTLAMLDASAGTLTLASSGLPHPVLLRDGQVTPLQVEGMPLGLFPDQRYEETTLRLKKGDVVAICSDGLHESIDEQERQFADRCLHAKLVKLGHLPAQDIADGMLEASQLHSGGSSHDDDRTIVVLKSSRSAS